MECGEAMVDATKNDLSFAGDVERDEDRLEAAELRNLEDFGRRISKFGANFAVCNLNSELILSCEGRKFKSAPERLMESGRKALQRDCDASPRTLGQEDCQSDNAAGVLAAILRVSGRAVAVALIDLG
ncbi:MAG: hypothetical protein ACYS21_13690, partial [Planctomycetota bacterium]